MKDSIVLEGRAYHSIKKVQQDFGLDHKTLTKWTRNGQLPVPVRLGNRVYFERQALESRLLETART
jgi:predicted site-specific integrase-resolvase